MPAGFVNQTIYVGPTTTISQSIWDTVGDGSGNKIPGVLVRDASGNVQPAGDATARPVYVAANPVAQPSANFSRPADATAYASGDLVANSTTAGSVTPLSWSTAARYAGGSGQVRRVRLRKSNTTTTNATFRLHLYTASPTCANGDNAAWSTNRSGYLGSIDLDMAGGNGRVFTDAAEVIGVPAVGSEINFVATATTVYGLLEARAAYTPASGETFTCELEIVQP